MKSILLGFGNERGSGPATVIAGPDVAAQDQAKLITGMKAANNYPDGIVRMEQYALTSLTIGIKIAGLPEKQTTTQSVTKKMKARSYIAALALGLFVSFSANAQTYKALNYNPGPATLATTVSTNLATPLLIDVRKQNNVAFQVRFNQSGASTSNVVYTLQSSIDGTYWDPTRVITLTFASTGATDVVGVTNVAINGVGYLRLVTIANTTAITTMTNKSFGYAVKIP